jgi:hypothetical protein
LANQVLVAESSDLTASRRQGLLGEIATRVNQGVGGITLAPQLSVTLTSTSADVPVTVLNSRSARAKVELILDSQKLSFHPFTTSSGVCTSQARITEICILTISPGATLLRVPVETRTSGVFALDLGLRSGDGKLILGQVRYTVRSTAVSEVAVVLMVVAAILLGVWWVRDRRHGRRARQLVDPPSEDSDEDVAEDSAGPEGGAGPGVGDQPAPATVPAVAPTGVAERWTPAPPTRFPRRNRRAEVTDTLSSEVGRQARRPVAAADPSAPSIVGGLWVDDDPVVAEFFATPPPFFVPPHGGNATQGEAPPTEPTQAPQGPGRSGSAR